MQSTMELEPRRTLLVTLAVVGALMAVVHVLGWA